jgi:hypothetical protein
MYYKPYVAILPMGHYQEIIRFFENRPYLVANRINRVALREKQF